MKSEIEITYVFNHVVGLSILLKRGLLSPICKLKLHKPMIHFANELVRVDVIMLILLKPL